MAKSLTSLIAEKNKWLKHDNLPDPKAAKPETKESVTVDPEKSAELKSNIQAKKDAEEFSKVDESGMKKNAMQAKRDQEEFSNSSDVPSEAQVKADTAKKQLEMYRKSEEKRRNDEKRLQDKYAQQLLYGITDSSEVLYEDPREKELQAEVDYWENALKNEKENSLFNTQVTEIGQMDASKKNALSKVADTRNGFLSKLNVWTDQKALEALKNPESNEYAREFTARQELKKSGLTDQEINNLAETYNRQRNAERAAELEANTKANVQEGGIIGGVKENLGAFATNAIAPLTGTAEELNAFIDRLTGNSQYSSADPNAAGFLPAQHSQAARDATSEMILGEDPTLLRQIANVAYTGGTSAVDSLIRNAMGGGKAGSLSLAGLGSLQSTFRDIKNKGGTDEQAFTVGLANAALEIATEYLPTDALFDIDTPPETKRQIITLALKQAGLEVPGEVLNLLGGAVVDSAVMGNNSNKEIFIQNQMIENGLSRDAAEKAYMKNLARQSIETAASSFFSAIGSATGTSTKAYVDNKLIQRATNTPAPTPAGQAQQPAAVRQEQTPNQTEQAAQPAQTVQEAQEQTHREQPTVTDPETKPEAPAPQQKAEPDWAEQTFRELDEQRKSDKERQQKAYEAVKAEERKVNQLEKDIAKAEKKLAETGKGSQARIDQMKQELERQKGIVAQRQRFLDYHDSSYDTNLESAIKTQQDLYENARMQVTLAIADYNDGRISEAQLQDAKDTYNNAGQELYRLKNMTPEQYRMELVSVGLLGDMGGNQNTARQTTDAQNAPAKTQQETAQQTQTAAETPLQRVTDTVTETITGRPSAASQTSTRKTDTQNSAKQETVRTQEQSAEGGQIKGTGAAETGFTPKQAMINEYGNIPEGENPVRPDQFPRSTDGNDRVSYTARTAAEARVTPDEFVPLIEREVVNQGFSFIPITNDETVQNATRRISHEGWETSRVNWTEQVRAGVTSPEISATGAILYNHAVNAGDMQTAMDILMDYQMAVRNTARSLQAARILKTLTPSDRLYMIRRSVDAMVQDMHLDNPVTIDESLAQSYQNAATQEEADEILDQIAEDVARQIPATRMESFTALRYLNMLGNFRTQGSNIAGNIGSKLVYGLKDKVGATIEAIASGLTNGRVERTKAFVTDRATRQAAAADYEQVRDWVMGNGRYNDGQTESDDFARRVQDRRRMLPRGLEEARRATEWAMNTGDEIFARDAYARALAGYLNARGIRTDNLETVAPSLLDNAREYAVRQAQEQTFRDNNQVSDFVSSIMRGRNTPTWARVIGEGVMPFRRTPANVLVRAEEFSPLGLINSAVNTVRAAQGQISGEQLIDSWAKSLTGTALTAMGWALYGMGVLSGGPDDDKDAEAYNQMNGNQNYAIRLKVGDKEYTYTIDWATPAAMPMFLGAQLKKAFDNVEDLDWADAEKVLTSIGDPLIQMSMLQGVNDTLDSIKYSDNSMGQFLINAVVSYVTQGIGNTLLGQLEKSTEDKRMMTYVDKDSATPEWMQKQLGKLSQKVPGWDYQQTEYINARGETEKQNTDLGGILYNMLSPGYAKEVKTDAVTEEMNRLNDAGIEGNVFPQNPDKTITWKDKTGTVHEDYNLTPEEYRTMAMTQGQTEQRIKEALIGTEVYNAMTDQQKADVVELVKDYARETGKAAALPDYDGVENWMKDLTPENEVGAIIRKAVEGSFTSAFSDITDDWKRGNDTAQSVEDLEQAWKNFSAMPQKWKTAFTENAPGRVKYFINAKVANMETETFADMYKQYQDIDVMDIKGSQKAQKWSNALEKAVDDGIITEEQKDVLKKDMAFHYGGVYETLKFDEMIERNVPTDIADAFIRTVEDLKSKSKNGDLSNLETYSAISGFDASESVKDEIMLTYMPDYDPTAKSPNTTEIKYQYVRQEMGLSAEDFAEAYGINNDGGKWKARAQKMSRELGISMDAAYDLIEIFEGKWKKQLINWYEKQ